MARALCHALRRQALFVRRWLPAAGPLVVFAAFLAIVPLDLASRERAAATGPGAPVVGIDMVPDAANTATGLGTIDKCREVPNFAGAQFTIDVWLDAVPSGQDLDAMNYVLHFPQAVKVVGQEHTLMFPAPPNLDLSESVPDPPGIDIPAGSPHKVGIVDLGGGGPVPAGTKGVLGRYTIEVMPSAPNASFAFTLDPTPGLLTFVGTNGDWTGQIAQVWDGSFSPKYGVIGLGVRCGTAVTTPTPTPTFPPTPTPPPPETPTATPSPANLTPTLTPPFESSTPSPSPDVGLYGDTNCDVRVDALDALFVLRRVAGLQPFASCIGAGNVKCDDDLNSVDALLILRHVAALSVSLPPGCPSIGSSPLLP